MVASATIMAGTATSSFCLVGVFYVYLRSMEELNEMNELNRKNEKINNHLILEAKITKKMEQETTLSPKYTMY